MDFLEPREPELSLLIADPSAEHAVPWQDSQHLCLCCSKILGTRTGMWYDNVSQWLCTECVTERRVSTATEFRAVSIEIIAAIVRSLRSQRWLCVSCNNFTALTREAMHDHRHFDAERCQTLLGGPFIDSGFGTLQPRVPEFACRSRPTACRFCGCALERLSDWPAHVMRDCQNVPCVLTYRMMQDGVAEYFARLSSAERDVLGGGNPVPNLSFVFENISEAHCCAWGTGEGQSTWSEMLVHLQRDIHDARHAPVTRALADMRALVRGGANEGMHFAQSEIATKSPRTRASSPCVIICGKRHPKTGEIMPPPCSRPSPEPLLSRKVTRRGNGEKARKDKKKKRHRRKPCEPKDGGGGLKIYLS